MSLTKSKKKFLSRITKIPERKVGYWYNVAALSIHKSPHHNPSDERNIILIMMRLYRNVKNDARNSA